MGIIKLCIIETRPSAFQGLDFVTMGGCGRTDKEDAEGDADKADAGKYSKFYAEFSKAVKLGIIEDAPNRNRLAKLLRFHTSKSGDKMVSLEQYVARMKADQKQIYYLSGAPVPSLRLHTSECSAGWCSQAPDQSRSLQLMSVSISVSHTMLNCNVTGARWAACSLQRRSV